MGIQGEDDSWDFGTGAGFYVDATASPWSNNYKMYSYITEELPKTVFSAFDQIDSSRVSISGHSMGGHGALSLYLRNPGKYKSVSAFAPIANPLKCPWGEKAFKGYFGNDWQKKGAEHDSTELLKQWKGGDLDILIDVVRKPSSLQFPNADYSIRALATTFINKGSSFLRTSLRLQRRLAKRRESRSDSSPIMITAITPWPHSVMIISITLPSTCLHSTSLVAS